MQYFRFLFLCCVSFLGFASADVKNKVISAVKASDCLQQFQYHGELSASNNENECATGGSSVWYVTPFCHGDCSNMRIRPFARVEVTCDDKISLVKCLA